MMRNETDQILDDLLSRYHAYCKGYKLSVQSADPMFRLALRAKGEQTLDAISEDAWLSGTMKSMDFQISEMPDPQRTAIYINARNCYTGRNVWLSPRLPQNQIERAQLLREARATLITRLVRVGII